jgi:hypothetical protein
LVTTAAPPIFAVFSAVPDEAGLDAGAEALDGVLLAPPEPGDELPHAAANTATGPTASTASSIREWRLSAFI